MFIDEEDEEGLEECECGSGELTDPGGCCKYCFDEVEGEENENKESVKIMGDHIETVTIKALVQENGIIRIDETGLFLARLDGIKFEDLKPFNIKSKCNQKKQDLENEKNKIVERIMQIDAFADTEECTFPPFECSEEQTELLSQWFESFIKLMGKHVKAVIENSNIPCKSKKNVDNKNCMDLDNAIEHALQKANELECSACGNEHKQLAEWLIELKDRRSKDSSQINIDL